ncbi:MAG: hypothetical protein JWM37_97 [Candidatus Saccharibacteria bacterium]|nr:hypothetical protein [Candidatus Saccharibacteria bacterium]
MRLAWRQPRPTSVTSSAKFTIFKAVDLSIKMDPCEARIYDNSLPVHDDEPYEVRILVARLLRHAAVVSVTLENSAAQLMITVVSHYDLGSDWLESCLCCSGLYRKVPPLPRFEQLATAS